ncbi:hypothetical protein DFH08DRAFT_929073 [Mycena albidolilacea]|uniref:Uncharacterized protein n=1 Tax=Mycena albidolilacea TaxID=1033008 RepID=A0AAD7AWI1_9AGAR|nr:hypothetical protein DFH08DRAFT_929073 [Mycena albidolilacea]
MFSIAEFKLHTYIRSQGKWPGNRQKQRKDVDEEQVNRAARDFFEYSQLQSRQKVVIKDTAHQKARYHRWVAAGPPVQWAVGCRLDVACVHVPNIKCRGVTSLTPLRLGSFVVMRSAIRLYLGEVLGIYRYGSVLGRHESFTDAETVDGLSYVSLRVYEHSTVYSLTLWKVAPECNINIFQHIAPPNRASARSLALFTHAPISEFVYLSTGVGIRALGNETCSLTGGDYGWERWQALTSRAVYRSLDVPGFDEDSDDESSRRKGAAGKKGSQSCLAGP